MGHQGMRVPLLCLLALAFALAPSVCVAYRSMGPYELMLATDRAQLMVIGEVAGTQDFDPNRSSRVSLIVVQRTLHGEAVPGDALSVAWSTGYDVFEDGTWRSSTEPGPQLDGLSGPHVWLLMEWEGALRSIGDPIPLSSSSRHGIGEYLDWARAPRVPYAGRSRDPDVARESGLDPQRGEVVRQILAAYLAGFLDARAGGW